VNKTDNKGSTHTERTEVTKRHAADEDSESRTIAVRNTSTLRLEEANVFIASHRLAILFAL
jgi:transcriptional regulator of NAD metabolism